MKKGFIYILHTNRLAREEINRYTNLISKRLFTEIICSNRDENYTILRQVLWDLINFKNLF